MPTASRRDSGRRDGGRLGNSPSSAGRRIALRRAASFRSRERHRVLEVRSLSNDAYVVRLSRDGLQFRAGQWIGVGLPRSRDMREYTIYSSPSDPYLEILVREVAEGRVSRALRLCLPGDELDVDGPYGEFAIDEGAIGSCRFTFVATGTGVSPFRCFARTFPDLDYTLLHGVRTESELYGAQDFEASRVVRCISGREPPSGAFPGRVTGYLAANAIDRSGFWYLCGNSDMIYEVFAFLRAREVPRSRVYVETYF